MPTLKKPVQTHEPRTLEESIVAWMEEQDGCVKEGYAIMPPPDACEGATHMMYSVAQFHVVTILLILLFLGILFGLTTAALKT